MRWSIKERWPTSSIWNRQETRWYGETQERKTFNCFRRSKMFKLAKSISPDTLLFLNDYGIIMDRWWLWSVNIPFGKLPFVLRNGRFALFQQQIRDLLAQGAPIDALGQIHDGRSRYICLLCQIARSYLCYHVFLTHALCLGLQSHIKGSELVDVVK